MSNKDKKDYLVKAISFSNSKGLPDATEELDRRMGYIKWGKKNDYPFHLIDMYNGSAWHQGIIKNKTYYIAGGGIEVVRGQFDKFLKNEYTDFNIEDVMQSCTFDYELFDAFAVLGTWNKDGTRVVKWEHVDVDALRKSEDNKYYYSDDWTSFKQDETTGFKEYTVLDKTNPTGQFIIYYQAPSKKSKGEKGVYPKPPYVGGLTAINTDVLISKYHLYEIQNGFKGGTIVNLANGQPETDEEARAHRDNIKGSTTNIEDANEVIITFSDGNDNAPSVLSLNGNDLADRYDLTEKSVQQNILVAHSATNPTMFGIIQEGSFNAAESKDLFQIFISTYVESRQGNLDWLLNTMAALSGVEDGEAHLVTPDPFEGTSTQTAQEPTEEVEDTVESTEPTDDTGADEAAAEGDVAGTALNGAQIGSMVDIVAAIGRDELTPESALAIILASFPLITVEQAEQIVGMDAATDTTEFKEEFRNAKKDLKVFGEYGRKKSEFKVIKSYSVSNNFGSDEVTQMEADNFTLFFDKIGDIRGNLTELDRNILKLLQDGEDGTSIQDALDATTREVAKSINKLQDLNLLTEDGTSKLGNDVLEGLDVEIEQFEVLYSYEVRAGLGAEVIAGSRDFCRELIRQDRMYSREEINTISARIGRDVWTKRGGFYHNPDTGRTTAWCRHEWQQHLVVKN